MTARLGWLELRCQIKGKVKSGGQECLPHTREIPCLWSPTLRGRKDGPTSLINLSNPQGQCDIRHSFILAGRLVCHYIPGFV
jgi:hypothetical protein